ncbi:MAG: D-Ala-D-Ala carboxypeptidase family metallohydrolase [Halobacteriales archaeon]|nr:D-Ala-D-Ala carboxypeptidase family metallohydrolase [Halobacteriales archaeon]
MSYEETESALAGLLADAGVRYFSARELLSLGGSHFSTRSPGYGLNTLPPCHLLPNILPTVAALDGARHRLGSPVLVNSVYRSRAYNTAIGGATRSFHLTFQAIDAHPADPALLSRLYRILRSEREADKWTGGLGGYRTFVHVDTGTDYNRNWGRNL